MSSKQNLRIFFGIIFVIGLGYALLYLGASYPYLVRGTGHYMDNMNESNNLMFEYNNTAIDNMIEDRKVYRVMGSGKSMFPTMSGNDYLLYIKNDKTTDFYYRAFQKGNIIIFERDGIQITHRVIDVKQDVTGEPYLLTKGDNNVGIDKGRVYKDDITGLGIGILFND